MEPLFAKMVLPRLGGIPSVWNTCMVFFQAALLAGYAYAHWTGRFAKQPAFHVLVLLAPFAVLPIAVPATWEPPPAGSPIGPLLLLLLARVGLPFFVLATSGPLIQRWAARAGEKDPYWLYAASNTGSMVGLLGYPLLLEPNLTLSAQSTLWSCGYGALAVLGVVCAVVALGSSGPAVAASESAAEPPPPLAPGRALRWIALSAVPSALMLGATAHITTDIASVPLLWVLPLALYILSFILVFAQNAERRHRIWLRASPVVLLLLAELILMEARDPLPVALLCHLTGVLVVSMLCHGELVLDRPPAAQLTTFYLLISVGGLVGGTLTSLVAPFVFTDVNEYPLALIAACALLPDRSKLEGRRFVPADAILPGLLGALALGLAFGLRGGSQTAGFRAIAVSVPVFLSFLFAKRPIRFALAIAAVFGATIVNRHLERRLIHAERSFFGIHRVMNVDDVVKDVTGGVTSETVAFRALNHGTTRHGMQRVDARRRPIEPRDPLSYYRREGPLGEVVTRLVGPAAGKKIAVVGLGAGTIAAYLERGQRLVYFEIDPAVARIAEDHFTYVREARGRGADVTTVLGDARLTLAHTDEVFDLLAVDAFSSDSIPLHLLTREAIERVYRPRIAPGGALLFHVSNRYLELRPILGDLGGATGLVCFSRYDSTNSRESSLGYATSVWVALARSATDLGPLATEGRWEKLEPRMPPIVWTDDRSDLLSAIRR